MDSTKIRRGLVSVALVAVPLALIVVMLDLGTANHHDTAGAALVAPSGADMYSRLLIALPLILAACHLAGVLFRRIGQPAVIGEIIAGVLLGPSLLGLLWPAGIKWLFPTEVVGTINTLAQLGLIFFMYLVGREIDLASLRKRGFTAVVVSPVSIALPMLTGIGLAFGLYPAFGGKVGFLPFALFLAVSMSVTAFPVLARILTDRGIAETPLGVLALTCAAVDDVAAWTLLAVVIAISQGGTPDAVFVTIALTMLFVAVLVWLVKPLLAKWLGRLPEAGVLPVLLGGIMLSALATNEIGIHPIFGAFLFGVISPRGVTLATKAASKLESVTVTLLLPLFFAYTGLRTQFGLLDSGELWAWCGLIILIAMAGKWAGSTVAARATGVGWRESLSLGALMNCRGLTELVVLNVGLQLKVITPTVFAMLVIMTLVSTVITSPALTAISRFRRPAGAVTEDKFLLNR
jgi:Kef-type K+ transport system membrane component KefB